MTHLELENLASDYLEGQLAPARRLAAEEHLRSCAGCRELLEGVRKAMALCHAAEDLEPTPWLVSRIMAATVGERRPGWWERALAFVKPALQPRVAYGVAMTIFSFSMIINVAGINLRNLRLQDLNPRTWIYQIQRNGHLLYGRVEKYYYDMKVVYEIESRLRQLQSQPAGGGEPPSKQTRPGGSTDTLQPKSPELASNRPSNSGELVSGRSDALPAITEAEFHPGGRLSH